MSFKDSNWICPSIPPSRIWIIKQDLWKAKPCMWKTLCELFMRSSLCLPIHPGAMCLPSLTWLLNYLLSFLLFSISLAFIVLSVFRFSFFPPECWHNSLLPHSLCTLSLYLELLSTCLTPLWRHPRKSFGPRPRFCSLSLLQWAEWLLSSSSLVK